MNSQFQSSNAESPVVGISASLVLAALMSGCLADDWESSEYGVGGEASGLDGTTVDLNLLADGSVLDSESVDGDGYFIFDKKLKDGANWAVEIASEPPDRACELDNASGAIQGENVTDVSLDCISAAQLSATADVMQLHVNWDGPDSVDLIYSSDPGCDWDQYSGCPDSGMIANASGGSHTLGVVADELNSDTGYFFVAEHDGLRSNPAAARAGAPSPLSVTGGVSEMQLVNDYLYIAGRFQGIRLNTGPFATFGGETGTMRGPLPPVAGDQINAITTDDDGYWYLAGDFHTVDGHEQAHLARLTPNGSFDDSWRPNLDGAVDVMTLADGKLFLGSGDYTEINGQNAEGLVALDQANGNLSSWESEKLASARSLSVYDGHIYMAGWADDGSGGYKPLAAFSLTDGSEKSWNAPQADDLIELIHVSDDIAYVGGSFDEIGGIPRSNFAAVSVNSGDVTDLDLAPDGHVQTMTSHDGLLYLGGSFGTIGGEARDMVAVFDPVSESIEPWDAKLEGNIIEDLVVADGVVYAAGGRIDSVDGVSRDMDHLVALDTDTADLLNNWQSEIRDRIRAIAYSDGMIAVGSTRDMGGHPLRDVAAIDRVSGIPDSDWTVPNFNHNINAMVIDGNRIYVGGLFTEVDGQTRNRIAALDRVTGDLITQWNDAGDWDYDYSAQPAAREMVIHNDTLYVGGAFSEIGGEPRGGIAAFNASNGEMVSDWNVVIPAGSPWSLLVDGDRLHVGGAFTTAGSSFDSNDQQTENGLVTVDLTSGEIDQAWSAGIDNVGQAGVHGMLVHDGILYLMGSFDSAGESNDENSYEPRDNLAAFDADTGNLIGDWTPATDSSVRSAAIDGGRMYLSGRFSELDDGVSTQATTRLGALDMSTDLIDPVWIPGVAGGLPYADQLLIDDGRIYLMGRFEEGLEAPADSGPAHRRHSLVVFDVDGQFVW